MLFSRCWDVPGQPPKAILQIAHGMNEHCGRYDRFARLLAENGYAVYANDHIGHGKKAISGIAGHFPSKQGGFNSLLQDMHTLYDYADREYPHLPHILFWTQHGKHRFRHLSARYPDIGMLILMGTPAQKPFSALWDPDCPANRRDRRAKAKRSQFLIRASEADTGKCAKDPMERNRWLSRGDAEVAKFVNDPLRGEAFSASAYGEMLTALREFRSPRWPYTIPEIPILITAGTDDSVGKRGAGPKFYYHRLIHAGHKNVTLKLLCGCAA